ncbi:hypothetical protein ACFXPA_22155 [Amycolatopsis sp. NPDC059090]
MRDDAESEMAEPTPIYLEIAAEVCGASADACPPAADGSAGLPVAGR